MLSRDGWEPAPVGAQVNEWTHWARSALIKRTELVSLPMLQSRFADYRVNYPYDVQSRWTLIASLFHQVEGQRWHCLIALQTDSESH
jgi:hypothetical protein